MSRCIRVAVVGTMVGGVEVLVAVGRAMRVASKEAKVKETRAEVEGI